MSFAQFRPIMNELATWKDRTRFSKDRQHCSYRAVKDQGVDAGWSIKGFIELDLSKQAMTAMSPPSLWLFKDASIYIEAAFKTKQKKVAVAWVIYDG